MTKYELSISANYVPSWGVVEGVRELFQNALDEETKDPANRMYFEYNEPTETLLIGNRNSTLEISSLLIGETGKHEDKYIGQHGEGYKIAMMVLLRTGHAVTFYNLTRREVWTTRLVKSRRYQGALVPTVFVEKSSIWKHDLDKKLVIEISNITTEEYRAITGSNLHLSGLPEHRETPLGNILVDPAYKGHVYVSGLFVCNNDQIKYGYDFKPNMIKLDRDRHLVDTFNLCWTASKLIAKTNDVSFIKDCLALKDGQYLNYADYSSTVADSVATDFKTKHPNAVPVSNMSEFNKQVAEGRKAIMVSEAEESLITKSNVFEKPEPVAKTLLERIEDWYTRFSTCDDESIVLDILGEFDALLDELRGVLR